MARLMLIHWNVTEAAGRAALLARMGHQVDAGAGDGRTLVAAVREKLPDAVVIDLSRQLSHGREVAGALRRQKATRGLPLVFVEGDAGKLAGVRALLPDATYTTWDAIRGDLASAISNRPATPAVPGTMDGYSGSPLPKKLGIRAGRLVGLWGAPSGFEEELGDLPEGALVVRQPRRKVDLGVLFLTTRAQMLSRFPAVSQVLAADGSLWLAWPKKASGVASDLTETGVRAYGLESGWVDYKVCAVDRTWSGLLFTRRRARKRAPAR